MKMKKSLAIFLSTVLLLSLFACGEINDSNPQKEQGEEGNSIPSQMEDKENAEKEVKEDLSFTGTVYTFEDHIVEKIHFFYTERALTNFCVRNGLEDNERFMQAVAKYDDSYFKENVLIWFYVDPEQDVDVEIRGIEHIKPSVDTDTHPYYTRDKYIINLHYKIFMREMTSFDVLLYKGLLIEVNGFHNMMLENTVINLTEEEYYPD